MVNWGARSKPRRRLRLRVWLSLSLAWATVQVLDSPGKLAKNNGDFGRVMDTVNIRQARLVRPALNLTVEPGIARPGLSSLNWIAFISSRAHQFLWGPTTRFDARVMGASFCLLLAGVVFLLLPRLPAPLALLWLGFTVSPPYLSDFNSYNRQACQFIALLGVSVWLYHLRVARRSATSNALLLGLAALGTWAGPQEQGFALLLALVLAGTRFIRKASGKWVIALLAGISLVAIGHYRSADQHSNYLVRCNIHNSLFTGLLLMTSDPASKMRSLGIPERFANWMGHPCYNHPPGNSYPQELVERFSEFSHLRIVAEYLREPSALARLVRESFSSEFAPSSYRHWTQPRLRTDGSLKLDKLRAWLLSRVPHLSLFLMGAAGLTLAARARRGLRGPHLCALFLLLSFFYEYGGALIGDGLNDLRPHLEAARLALDLLGVLVVFEACRWIRKSLRRAWIRRNPSPLEPRKATP